MSSHSPGLQPESSARRNAEQGPRLRGCDRAGVHEARAVGALPVPLRGRIQANCAWNLLRPARDTLSASGAKVDTLAPSAFASSTILVATHACFMLLGALDRSRKGAEFCTKPAHGQSTPAAENSEFPCLIRNLPGLR